MRDALAIHDAILREEIDRHGGYEVKTEGDAFMVAFADAIAAVTWMLAVQTRLHAAAWPPALLALPAAAEEAGAFRGLRVRMGVNAGAPECRSDPTTGRMDYFGPVVNRAARIAAAAHGGQLLLAERVRALAGDPPDAEIRDLGIHRLRDLATPERLFQILPRTLSGRVFPPLRTAETKTTNLPSPPGPFIGRDGDLAAMTVRIAGGARLLTIMGPGGIGKTRLAIRFAQLRLDDLARAGGVWFCDLAEARDMSGVCAAVARSLDIVLQGDAVGQLGDAIAARGRVLIVLDNFEQVVAHAGTTIGRWTATAPEARFVVTSQERLALPGEELHELGPLGVEAGADGVKLFVERARAARRGWTPSPADASVVAEIVRTLDGIPLAIELAAARIGVLSPAKILERLKKPLDALGSSRAHSRHATLRAALEWSWGLLAPHEASALAQCSVFHGGFALEAAEEILSVDGHEVLDVIQSLRDKSLLRGWDVDELAEIRFGLYTTVHAFAAEKLADPASVRERHARHYLRVAGEWADGVDRHGGLEKLRRLALERDNLTSIFESAIEEKKAERALESVSVLDPVLSIRGPFSTHLEWLDAALAAKRDDTPPSLVARVLEMRARTRRQRGRMDEAAADASAAAALAVQLGDHGLEARALSHLGFIEYARGHLEDALRTLQSALAIARGAADARAEAQILGFIAIVYMESGHETKSRLHFEEAIALHRTVGARRLEGITLGNLGILLRRNGHFADAHQALRNAIAIHDEIEERRTKGTALSTIGGINLEEGKYAEARTSYEQALVILRDVGDVRSQAIVLGNLSITQHLQGNLREAKAWYERALLLMRQVGDRRMSGLYLGYYGAAQVALGALEDGRRSFEEARSSLAATGDELFLAAVDVLEGVLDFALARAATRPDEAVVHRTRGNQRIAAVTNGERPAASRSDDVRLAIRIAQQGDEAHSAFA